jgi:hypothetical protein
MSNYTAQYSTMGQRFASKIKPAVDFDYDLPANIFESYLEEHELEDSEFTKCYKVFKENKIDIKNVTLSDILNSFLKNNKFVDNKELYEQIVKFFDYAVSKNLLHRTKRESYENSLNKALFQENANYVNPNVTTYEEPDCTQYEDNNFRETTNNDIINGIYDSGGAIFIISDLKIWIKLTKESEGDFYSFRQAEKYLSLMFGLSIKITEDIEDTTNDPNIDIIEKRHTISTYELILVHGTKFSPYIQKEYFKVGGITYRNSFIPTKYMKLKGEPKRLPKSILDLIFHLVNYNTKKYDYLLNWLAFFFKYLKKSQVAIALIGSQGAGKGVLFNIISDLFGRIYCITINNESINSKYKAKIIKDKLFYNFDEVTLDTSKENDGFIKAVITNPSISLEEKNVTMAEETELYGQCLFSSNHLKALNIPKDDRRFSVLTTGEDMRSKNFFGYRSYENLESAIANDMEEFARYLKNYPVDISLANTVLDTPERRAIINASENHFEALHKAIITRDINYLDELQDINNPLFIRISSSLARGVIDRADITLAYNALYSGRKVSTKEIMEKFRELKPHDIFSQDNIYHSGNSHYFRLPWYK